MPRSLALIVCFALSLALAGCTDREPGWNGKAISGLLPELRFELTSESGERITEEAFQDDFTLVFFGFSHCHNICPVTLRRLVEARDRLPPPAQKQLEILFISVDPERDSPQRLRNYTANFGDNITGMTGSHKSLRALTKRFRATYGYGKEERNGDYQVSHSNAVYVFDDRGKARLLYKGGETADEIAADLKRLIGG